MNGEVSATDARARMVAGLNGIGSGLPGPVQAALMAVPREHFLPPEISLTQAYTDAAVILSLGADGFPASTASQPSVVAAMLEQLSVRPGDRILEIGTASGYNAALLHQLTGATGSVDSVEIDGELAATAAQRLGELAAPVSVHAADGWDGVPAAAPFDRIITTVGIFDLSPRWLEQLREGGILVAPLWLRPGVELSIAFHRSGDALVSRSAFRCSFLRLRGDHAGPDSYRKITDTRFATCEELPDDQLETLRALLTAPPEIRPAPALPEHWFAGLAVHDSRAIQVFTLSDQPEICHGLFDAETGGLALVAANELRVHGNPAIAAEFHTALSRSRPLDPARLTIRAVPSDAPRSAGQSAVTIPRRHFRYLIDTE